MKTFPIPAVIALAAAFAAVPFCPPGAVMLFVTAGLGFIIHADYTLRYRRIRLPRHVAPEATIIPCESFACEDHRLAA